MRMSVELKVLTFNCWGIPGFSSNRKERMDAIATEISTGNYDFVVLQEVWSVADYERLAKKSFDALPFSHYFHSGVTGSGLCVFSREPIVDTLYQRWPLNGYAHKVRHGDWFGGKGVGLCRVVYRGLNINVYTAHLHAEYNPSDDEYLAHRVGQAFEFSQFVKLTGGMSDLNIVAGDFNAESSELIYDILRVNADLLDSFVELGNTAANESRSRFPTNGRIGNSYTSKSELSVAPHGKQIDYILYNYNSRTFVKTLNWDTPLDKVPNHPFSFSDHEAVVVVLQVTKSADFVSTPTHNPDTRRRVFNDVDLLMGSALKKLDWDQKFYLTLAALVLCLLLGTAHLEGMPYGLHSVLVFGRIFLSIGMAFCVFMGFVWNRMERNSITSVRQMVRVLLNGLLATAVEARRSSAATVDIQSHLTCSMTAAAAIADECKSESVFLFKTTRYQSAMELGNKELMTSR